MLLDAIVLAGGRSSRLFGVPKSALLWRGSTLLQNTVDAVLDAGARRVVVVGPGASVADGAAGGLADGDGPAARIMFAREDPPFGGPAAAIAAGLSALGAFDVRDALDVLDVLGRAMTTADHDGPNPDRSQ
jgi:CTP:molybdopterin cytidylyltransferase MocA